MPFPPPDPSALRSNTTNQAKGMAMGNEPPPPSANSGLMDPLSSSLGGASNDYGMAMQAATPNDVRTQPTRYCYAHGPLLPTSLLPKPRKESYVDIGSVSCEEVVGYLMGLNRWYDRKCSNMGPECPDKYRFAASWFISAVNKIKQSCSLTL